MKIVNEDNTILAIELLSQGEIEYYSDTKERFCVYGFIYVMHSDDVYEVSFEGKHITFEDGVSLLNFLLVETNKRNFLAHLEHLFMDYEELNFHTKEKLEILAKFSPYSEAKESIFKRTLYGSTPVFELAEQYNVNKRIFQQINNQNRKVIIQKLLKTVDRQAYTCEAA
ncbi:hypothetical protein JHD46_02180 [Sulfurimonas sp. SAG-AH-194-C20]|nr:hypothetical protein [Sulfurimonas sp. SAG-AH-194-C20]MDF1878443.1 hypothetical protein [Sulfurimonas sp. SAG-AH-194-C20]